MLRPTLAVVAVIAVAVRRRRRRDAPVAAATSVGARPVTFAGPAGTLRAWEVAPDPAVDTGTTVLAVHGYASQGSDLLPLAPALAASGLRVVALDLRGHGGSDGDGSRPRPSALVQDVDAAVDWLHARTDVARVSLLGHSMGGSTAILAAAGRSDVHAVVTVAAVADPTLTRIGWWPAVVSRLLLLIVGRRRGVDVGASFAVARLADVRAPVLMVHGCRDRIVPIRHLDALAAAAPGVRTLRVPAAGHTSIEAFAPVLSDVARTLVGHATTGPAASER